MDCRRHDSPLVCHDHLWNSRELPFIGYYLSSTRILEFGTTPTPPLMSIIAHVSTPQDFHPVGLGRIGVPY